MKERDAPLEAFLGQAGPVGWNAKRRGGTTIVVVGVTPSLGMGWRTKRHPMNCPVWMHREIKGAHCATIAAMVHA